MLKFLGIRHPVSETDKYVFFFSGPKSRDDSIVTGLTILTFGVSEADLKLCRSGSLLFVMRLVRCLCSQHIDQDTWLQPIFLGDL